MAERTLRSNLLHLLDRFDQRERSHQNMSTIIGIMLDVSGSMRESYSEGVDVQGGKWIESIFTVMNDLVKHDLSRENRVFAIGFGSNQKEEIFDLLMTLQPFSEQDPAQYHTIEKGFLILEQNGARNIRKWAEKDVIRSDMKEFQAQIILRNLTRDEKFREWFVLECLPRACRDWSDRWLVGKVQGGITSTVTTFKQATPKDIRDIIKKVMKPDRISVLECVSSSSVCSAKHASDIIHGCVDEEGMTTQRARDYLELIEPYIYGGTPMFAALKVSTELYPTEMGNFESDGYERLLFVLTDGCPADRGDIDQVKRQLDHRGVKIVGCYISDSSNVEPKRLYSTPQPHWETGAKWLFSLSSLIPTSIVIRSIFMKQKWKIDIENNETRLFVHVNHPEHLRSACELARKAVCCQDALSEILVSVSLDRYINQKNRAVRAHDQGLEETCYAHAAATVVHLAMCRILGRDGGYPEFEQLRDDMISRHGRHGANTLTVLEEVCSQYRLRCREVDCQKAMRAVAKKRPVVARFRLTTDEWNKFNAFYRNERTRNSILRKSDIDIALRRPDSDTSGHAVVLTSYNNECLSLMNSWGDKWGNNGFFKVENAQVLGLKFIDVYWKEKNLSETEKDYYRAHGSEVAATLIRSLKALQEGTFKCPLCKETSNVNEFTGTLLNALCPRCNQIFSSKDGNGNLLALNMYLTSLCA